jgi:uncharacterized membrane protein YecN with MAPEG domain
MSLTGFYAALFGALFVMLSARVIWLRMRLGISLGSGGNPVLERARRAHANFAEYAPFSLLLIYFFEAATEMRGWTHGFCIILLVGRMLHACGLTRGNAMFRTAGMALTLAVIAAAVIGLLVFHVHFMAT